MEWLAKPKLRGVHKGKLSENLNVIRDGVETLLQVAEKVMASERRDPIKHYGAVVAEHLVSMCLQLQRRGGHRSLLNTCVERAGQTILKLLPENHGSWDVWALRGAALSFLGKHDEALAALERILLHKASDIHSALGQTQQLTQSSYDSFFPIAQCMQAVLEGEIAFAMGAEQYVHLRSARMEIRSLRRRLAQGSDRKASGEVETGDVVRLTHRAERTLKRLQDILHRCNLALPVTSFLFVDTMQAFDDLLSILPREILQDFARDLLQHFRDDIPSQIRCLAALSAGLVRSHRIADAVSLYRLAKDVQAPLPTQATDALIRSASGKGADELVEDVVRIALTRASGELPLSTWLAYAGHVSRRGDDRLLKLLWTRILKSSPSQRGSALIQDHFLVAYSRDPSKFALLRRHVAQYWNAPGIAEADRNSRKRDFSRHTFLAVIQGYTLAGHFSGAAHYLDLMKQAGLKSDIKAHNAILQGYVRRQDLAGAAKAWRDIYEDGLTPDPMTFELMAKLFAVKGDVRSAYALLDVLESRGIKPTRTMLSSLMTTLTRTGEHQRALELFKAIVAKDGNAATVQAWNALLRIQVHRSMPTSMVMRTLRDMDEAGVIFDQRTYALAMQSACDSDNLGLAEHLFAQADGGGVEVGEPHEEKSDGANDPNPLDAEPRDVADANEPDALMARISRPRANAYHFTILIHAHLRLGNVSIAKEYFDEMQKRELPIDSINWAILVRAYTNSDSESSQRLARDIVMRRMEDAEQATTDPEDASTLVPQERRGSSTEILVAPLLIRAAEVGDIAQIEGIVGELEADGVEVSIPTMNILLMCYRQIQDVESLLAAWERMFNRAKSVTGFAAEMQIDDLAQTFSNIAINRRRSSIRYGGGGSRLPDSAMPAIQRNALCISLTIVLDTLLEAKRHEAIAGIWTRARAAGFAFDPSNWNGLTIALARAGRVEDSLKVLQDVLNEMPVDLQPNSSYDEEIEARKRRDIAKLRNTKALRKERDSEEEITTGASSKQRRQQAQRSEAQAAAAKDDNLAQTEEEDCQADEVEVESHSILEALERQDKFEQLQAVWIAHENTLLEVLEALDKKYEFSVFAPSAHAQSTEGSAADEAEGIASSAPPNDSLQDMLAKYPRARELLNAQRYRNRAMQDQEDEEQEQMARAGQL